MNPTEFPKTIKPKLQPLQVYCKENFKMFLKHTSLNGLKYIEDSQRTTWERIYYLIAFSMVFTAGLYMSIYFLQKWESTPVLNTMSARATSIQEVPFPAITFCNMNQALVSKVEAFQEGSLEYGMLQKICFQDYNYSDYKNVTPRFEGDNLVNFMLKNSQSCREMIVYCKFGPNEETCTDLFREIALDEGICCAFNQLHPFYLYKGSNDYIHDYTSSNGHTTIPVKWNLEDGYPKKLPKRYYPRKAAGSGVSMGLTVVLNANIDEYFCSSTNGEGFKVLLYNPLDWPHIKESGLPIMLGRQTLLRINSKLWEAQDSLRQTKPKDRQCYFSNEKELLYYKFYTRRNCEMECEALQMLRRCNCVRYFMPKPYPNVTTCFFAEAECVTLTERLIFDPEKTKCKEDCLSSCHDLAFYPDMFISPLATGYYYLEDNFFRNMSRDLMKDDLALVHIYYADNFIRGNTKVPFTGLTEFLSQTGGILGLMVGFGVISIVEISFFILLKPFFDMLLKRDPMLLTEKDDMKVKVPTLDKFHPQMLFKRRRNINNRVMVWQKRALEKYHNEKY